jgi:hypothetical protein
LWLVIIRELLASGFGRTEECFVAGVHFATQVRQKEPAIVSNMIGQIVTVKGP